MVHHLPRHNIMSRRPRYEFCIISHTHIHNAHTHTHTHTAAVAKINGVPEDLRVALQHLSSPKKNTKDKGIFEWSLR